MTDKPIECTEHHTCDCNKRLDQALAEISKLHTANFELRSDNDVHFMKINELQSELTAANSEIERLKADHALIMASVERQRQLNDAQSEKLREAEAALEWYANKENWEHGIAYSQNNLMIESDMYCEKGSRLYAGKKAREALKKIRGEK